MEGENPQSKAIMAFAFAGICVVVAILIFKFAIQAEPMVAIDENAVVADEPMPSEGGTIPEGTVQ